MPEQVPKASGKRKQKTNRPTPDEEPHCSRGGSSSSSSTKSSNSKASQRAEQRRDKVLTHIHARAAAQDASKSPSPPRPTSLLAAPDLSLDDPSLYRASAKAWEAQVQTEQARPVTPPSVPIPGCLPHQDPPSLPNLPVIPPDATGQLHMDLVTLQALLTAAVKQGIASSRPRNRRGTRVSSPPQTSVSRGSVPRPTQSEEEERGGEDEEGEEEEDEDEEDHGPILDPQEEGLVSEEEDLTELQPPAGLFPPALFRSLLHKTRTLAGMPASAPAPPSDAQLDPIFSQAIPEVEFVPAPPLFLENVSAQWKAPASGPQPTSLDRKHFNVAPEFSSLLEVPSVDPPVLALYSNAAMPGTSVELLRPEEKRTEQALVKAHQASAWAIKAASSASYFSRSAVLWLRSIQAQIPEEDVRTHQELNRVFACAQYAADASLHASRFAAKSMGASIAARRMLWLKQWQVDSRHKWRLAASPFQGPNLFGASLDPIVTETKDKRKILPTLSRRGHTRPAPYPRRPFRPADQGFSTPRAPGQSNQFSPRQRQQYGGTGRGRASKKPFRGGYNRPYRRFR